MLSVTLKRVAAGRLDTKLKALKASSFTLGRARSRAVEIVKRRIVVYSMAVMAFICFKCRVVVRFSHGMAGEGEV